MLLALLLVQLQSVSPLVLAAENYIQESRDSDQHSVTTNNTFPDARVLVADLLGADPEWADDVAF